MNEEEIKASYDGFISQIDQNRVNSELNRIKILNTIGTILGIYGVLSFIEDLSLYIEIFNPIIGAPCGIISMIIIVIAWKKKLKIDNICKEYYKQVFESYLNIKIDDDDSNLQKFPASDYKETGFKHHEDVFDYYYECSKKIQIDKEIEAYLIELDAGSVNDTKYVIYDWITKQKTDVKGKHNIKDTNKIVESFNKQYGYDTKNKVDINIHNGNIYILIENIDWFFWYSSLVKYKEYKKFYSNLKLVKELSKYIHDNINNFITSDN